MTNAQIAEALEELAVLYQLDGADQYRVLAYTNSARTIKSEGRSVEEMAKNGTITELPGVGKTLEEKIVALVETGEIPAAAKLKEKIPVGLLEISRIPGLGPKTVRRLHDELDVTGPEDLRAAAEAQKVRGLKGLGPKVEEKILAGLDRLEAEPEGPARLRLDEIRPIAEELVAALRADPNCDKAEIAGSVRRWTETCKDVDLIATSPSPKELATAAASYELIAEAGKPSDKGVKLTTNSGIGVDLRIVAPEAFGNLLQHFSGSGAHNAELRERAVAQGLHVSENGIKDDNDTSRGAGETESFGTEQEVYARLGYQYIAPELRENRGELDAAAKGELPDLIERSQIKGDLHSHTTLSDGVATLEEMAAAAEALGYEYLAITDHSESHGFGNNVAADRLWQRIEEISEFNHEKHGIRLLSGSEVNIHPDGSVDYEDDLLEALDWVIASIHTSFSEDEKKNTDRMIAAIENPLVDCIGHPTGRLINQRDPYPLNIERVIAAAIEHDTMIEINSNPRRRDLNEIHARMAAEAGVRIVINTDAHRPETLDFIEYGIATARRAWITADQVMNTRSWWK
ncbi:MAG: DNA polymerase/3'-5' exonuclease PolX [Solirubrobacterales bacterium]|nr:DNA polymerase/3'-5' exonuclease PolX [Solirubrobacterales bacterium]